MKNIAQIIKYEGKWISMEVSLLSSISCLAAALGWYLKDARAQANYLKENKISYTPLPVWGMFVFYLVTAFSFNLLVGSVEL